MTEPLSDVQPASVGNRILARIIDGVLLFVASFVFFALGRAASQALSPFVGAAYEIFLVASWGQTLGKRALSVQIQQYDAPGAIPTSQQAFMRWLVLSGPGVLFGILAAAGVTGALLLGLLWAVAILVSVLNDPLKRGWHDKFAGTIVVDLD